MVSYKDGWFINKKIIKEQKTSLEHGSIATINALVLHRTGSNTAKSVLSAWKNKKEGTHFLISETGEIYQTASMKKKCWHVGKLYSKCRTVGVCSTEDAKKIESMLHKKIPAGGKNSN